VDSLNAPFGLTLRRLPDFIPFRMGPLETPCTNSSEIPKDLVPLKIYPNPVLDIFSITCSSIIDIVEIYNINGQIIDNFRLINAQDHYKFSTTGWIPGVYVVLCRGKMHQVIGIQKLMKL